MSGLTKFDIVKAEINLRNEVERMFGEIKWDTPTDAYDAAVSDEANMNYSIWAKLYGTGETPKARSGRKCMDNKRVFDKTIGNSLSWSMV